MLSHLESFEPAGIFPVSLPTTPGFRQKFYYKTATWSFNHILFTFLKHPFFLLDRYSAVPNFPVCSFSTCRTQLFVYPLFCFFLLSSTESVLGFFPFFCYFFCTSCFFSTSRLYSFWALVLFAQFYVRKFLAHCKCTGISTVVDNSCVSWKGNIGFYVWL